MNRADVKRSFDKNLKSFGRYFDVSKIRLRFHSVHPEKECRSDFRAVAWYDPNDLTINLLNRALEFDEDTITGLLIHEIGHAVDGNLESEAREQRADDLAELCTGKRIFYAGPHKLQTVKSGEWPRPKSLHR